MSFSRLDAVLAEAASLGRLFTEAGHRLFLVGGIVRDQWLDQPLDAKSDIDLTTDALPGVIKELVSDVADDLWTQGERFGTIGLRTNGRDLEITTHRAESYASDSRKPTVSFGDDIAIDLSRRDFTVNAMAIELPDGELVDPYGGSADLEAGLLRTPLSADVSFTDDPLRMLRAARFASRLNLVVGDEIVESATRLHERIRIVAIERIGIEMRRLLSLPQPLAGLEFLTETGLLREVLSYGSPDIGTQIQSKLGPAVERANALDPDWHLRLAAIGMSVFDDPGDVYRMCKRLRLSRDDERAISRMSRDASTASASALDAPSLRRWVASASDPERALVLAEAIGQTDDAVAHIASFSTALDELLAVEDPTNQQFLDGASIMAELGVSPGPAIGQATAFLHECYFEHGPLPQDQQLEALQRWWADRATNS